VRLEGRKIQFDAPKLGEILGVPATGFDVYVREDKSVLGQARLLELSKIELANRLANTPKCEERGDVFTTSVDLLICDQEHHSQGSGAQHGRCDGSVLH